MNELAKSLHNYEQPKSEKVVLNTKTRNLKIATDKFMAGCMRNDEYSELKALNEYAKELIPTRKH